MMAEGILIEGKSLEELEREITCGICQEHYTEPKILPCLHYYCKQCVLRLATRTGLAKSFSCPECRSEATLPKGGVDELKTAFFINRLKTTVSTMERAQGKVEVKCELGCDSEAKAVAFCRQCAMFICKDCVVLHKRLKPFLTHEVASLEDLKQGQTKPIVVQEPSAKICPDHKEPLIVYCYDCVTLICHHCTAKDHRDHNFEFCIKEAPKIIEILLEKLKPLKNQKESLTKALNTIQTIKQEVKEQQDSVANSIRVLFKELHNILDQREQDLLGQAADIGQKKLEKLSAQEKKLFIASAEVQSVVDYTEQCVRHCTDNEVMSMHTEIRRQIEQKVEEHSKSGRSLEPEEEADIGVEVRCREALQQLIQTQANIIQLPVDPTKCTVTMEDNKDPEVNKLSTAVLVTRLPNNKILRRHHEVSCSLRSLYNNVRTQCKVDATGAGQYSIQYTPTVRGRHELTVSVDEQQVAGSPFPVFVSIHPTQLGKPLKVWRDINDPSGITINSVGDILVCSFDGSIIKLDKDVGKRTLLEHEELKCLWKIEVDDKNIFSVSLNSNKILKCSHNGSNVQVIQLQHIERGLRDLVLINGEVMIGDYYTKGTVMVYDKELKYVRRIELQRMITVHGLSADCSGNLCCADYSEDMIHVFGNDGVFMHSFGYDEEGEKKVNNPCGLCVSGHYVYVCNCSHNISVFTTDGVYVTSFGQHGSDEGDFNWPHSVCVDKDGFVYVTDFNNGRIQCF